VKNWRLLSNDERKHAWGNFYSLFDFKPSIKRFPGIRTELPKKKFSIEKYFTENVPFDKLEDLALSLFVSILKPGQRLYALNWQHDCYDFDPRLEMDRDEFDEWIIPVLPNGDYHIFVTKDFQNVWFGHPWEMTITLIGCHLLKQVKTQSVII